MKYGLLSLIILSLAGAGCSTRANPADAANEPVSQDGLIVRGASLADATKIAALPAARIKLLHSESGLYKVGGVSEAQIRAVAQPRLMVSANYVFENLLAEVPTAHQVSFFDTCKPTAPGAPEVAGEIAPLEPRVIQYKQAHSEGIAFKALSGVEAHWSVLGPLGPTAETIELDGTTVRFVPKAPGGYVANLITKGADGVCGKPATARFIVTHDEPLAPRPALRALTLQEFGHLDLISARALRQRPVSAPVTVAVLDTGVNYNHVDLRSNIITDDHAVFGYDFANGDAIPFDDNGHGTHVAGLVAGRESGVAPNARIMPVKVLDAFGGGELIAIEAGIRFAVDWGAKVIVLSFGSNSPKFREGLEPAIEYAAKHDVLIVAAAGNKKQNLDVTPHFPASLGAPNLISVAATDADGRLASYSSFGGTTVDLAAPGGERLAGLLSTSHWPLEAPGYAARSGTSMAAPLVAGAAALILMAAPERVQPIEIKEQILKSARLSEHLNGVVRTGTILNLEKLIK